MRRIMTLLEWMDDILDLKTSVVVLGRGQVGAQFCRPAGGPAARRPPPALNKFRKINLS